VRDHVRATWTAMSDERARGRYPRRLFVIFSSLERVLEFYYARAFRPGFVSVLFSLFLFLSLSLSLFLSLFLCNTHRTNRGAQYPPIHLSTSASPEDCNIMYVTYVIVHPCTLSSLLAFSRITLLLLLLLYRVVRIYIYMYVELEKHLFHFTLEVKW